MITNNPTKFEELMNTHSNVTLKKLSDTCNVCYNYVLKMSKTPIKGEVYDDTKVNYTAVCKIFDKKDIDLTTLDWTSMDVKSVKNGSTVVKDLDKFGVGTKVYLRMNKTVPYEVVYRTMTHIVIVLEGTTEPHCLSYETFMMKGPSLNPRKEVIESNDEIVDEDPHQNESVDDENPTDGLNEESNEEKGE